MSTPEEKNQEDEFLAQARKLQGLVQSQASADAMMLVLSIAALMPVVQSIMSFSAAGSRQNHQAVNESCHTSQTGLATTAMAIGSLLNPRHEPQPPPERQAPPHAEYPYVT